MIGVCQSFDLSNTVSNASTFSPVNHSGGCSGKTFHSAYQYKNKSKTRMKKFIAVLMIRLKEFLVQSGVIALVCVTLS